MKKPALMQSSVILSFILFAAALLLPAGLMAAEKPGTDAAESVSYNVNASMQDNLKSLAGKRVYVTLDSGNTMTGTVKEVGNHLLHLEKLDGKEYFDALIRIDSISAIDTRFRNFTR
jgi:small nuclear ribonucleoprotein (snRNP)-like protein